jgi:hypothetical protein
MWISEERLICIPSPLARVVTEKWLLSNFHIYIEPDIKFQRMI